MDWVRKENLAGRTVDVNFDSETSRSGITALADVAIGDQVMRPASATSAPRATTMMTVSDAYNNWP